MVSDIMKLMKPSQIIPLFDEFLSERKLSFDGIVIGGAALEILGVVSRETYQDLNPDWPKHVDATLKHLAKKLGYEL